MNVIEGSVRVHAKIILETTLDFAIMKALLETVNLKFDEAVTTELFRITGKDERRNVSQNEITNFIMKLHDELDRILEMDKEYIKKLNKE